MMEDVKKTLKEGRRGIVIECIVIWCVLIGSVLIGDVLRGYVTSRCPSLTSISTVLASRESCR